MRRLASLTGLALLTGLTGILPVQALGADRPPNIVLILADDLGWGDVSLNGRKEWSTPHIDGLAAQGAAGRRVYTCAVVCAPSRGALLTGKNTIHSGVSRNNDDLPSEQTTIAEGLKAKGYATGLFGKWHHGKPRQEGGSYVHPLDQGFDEFFGYTDARDAWEKFPSKLWDGRQEAAVSGHADDLFVDRGIDFLNRHKDGPFFLYIPLIATHFHIAAPAEDVERFRGKFPEADPANPLNATYAAMATRLDANVGRVLKTLDDLGLAENTLVVFTSDHGATFEVGNKGASDALDSNAPFRGQKRTLWEGGIRVPTAIRWPGHITPGTVSDQPIQLLDLFPTFLAAAGVPPSDRPSDLDGIDLLPHLTGKSALPDRTLFWEWRTEGSNQVAALRGDLKLVITNDGKPELFNVVKDPAERRDVSAAYPGLTKELQESIKTWLATEVKF